MSRRTRSEPCAERHGALATEQEMTADAIGARFGHRAPKLQPAEGADCRVLMCVGGVRSPAVSRRVRSEPCAERCGALATEQEKTADAIGARFGCRTPKLQPAEGTDCRVLT